MRFRARPMSSAAQAPLVLVVRAAVVVCLPEAREERGGAAAAVRRDHSIGGGIRSASPSSLGRGGRERGLVLGLERR